MEASIAAICASDAGMLGLLAFGNLAAASAQGSPIRAALETALRVCV